MKTINKSMLSIGGGLLALAAAGALTIGATLSLFSASDSSSASAFATGTVAVGLGDSASVTCNVTEMSPGDSSTGAATGSKSLDKCTYNVKYTGSLPAWLSVDVTVNTTGTNLYTAGATGLQFYVKNGSTSIIDGVNYKVVGGTNTPVTSGVTVEHILPLLAPNALQGGTTSIALTFNAVQSANQPIGSCVAGRQCNSITWS
jgi:predicted ribosomally synthesized peptide with SipW-like signal peptide